MKRFSLYFFLFTFALFKGQAFAASGCAYPTSLDSYVSKQTGDYLTTADINSRSCAIEQLEAAQRQILVTGKAGGNTIFGGSGAGEGLTLRSTFNATRGPITLDGTSATLGSSATAGPRFVTDHTTSASDIGGIEFHGRDGSNAARQNVIVSAIYLDATTASQDSEIQFCVQNNVNAGGCNMVARLSSLGVWTDASTAASKQYEGDLQGGSINKLKQLTTIGVYRAANLPAGKVKNAERHYGPTAEDFNAVFGLGDDKGISPKDAAFVAARAVLELEARVQALEKKIGP